MPPSRVPSALGLTFVALLAGCLGPTAPRPTGPDDAAQMQEVLMFAPNVTLPMEVGSYRWGFEPSVVVHGDEVYLTAAKGVVAGGPPEASWLWVSHDGGQTFETIPDVGTDGVARSPEGAEGHIDVNAEGTAYFVELTLQGIPVSRSTDQGHTWELMTPSANLVPGGDRQWVAAGAGDTVYVVWNHLATGYWIFASEDGGRTFPVQTRLAMAVPAEDQDDASKFTAAGTPAVAPDGALYVARAEEDVGVAVYKSTDGGRTFTRAAAMPGSYSLFPVITIDEAGTIFVVATQEGPSRAVYSYSTDGGQTFAPTREILPDGELLQTMAWGAAASTGTLAVAWYEAETDATSPNDADADWYIAAALSTDAAREDAVFVASRVTQRPVQTGAICTEGLTGCSGDARNLGDYLGVDVTPDGAVHVTWTDATPGGQAQTIGTSRGVLETVAISG